MMIMVIIVINNMLLLCSCCRIDSDDLNMSVQADHTQTKYSTTSDGISSIFFTRA